MVIEVPAAMLTVQVYETSEVGWSSIVVMILRARQEGWRVSLWQIRL